MNLILNKLWFLFNPRINLSPFTKDFRKEEHYNEYNSQIYLSPVYEGKFKTTIK